MLAKRMLSDEPLELSDHSDVLAKCEISIDPVAQRPQPKLLETSDRSLQKSTRVQRRPTPVQPSRACSNNSRSRSVAVHLQRVAAGAGNDDAVRTRPRTPPGSTTRQDVAGHHPGAAGRPTTLPRVDVRPIGVFDSGVGGLTVLHECLVTMPHEDFVYLGDHARLPYGPRPLDELRRFAGEIAGYLEEQGVKLIVAACNAATSAALPQLQESLEVPVVGVITPEAHAAVQATRNRRVGLLATQATVTAGRYASLVHALDAGVEFFPVACPRLVPLIESADPFGGNDRSRPRVRRPLKKTGVDTVILGCTHYPLIRPIFQRVFGRDVTLVFSAEETAREVAETLARKRIENDPAREGEYRFLTTGDPPSSAPWGALPPAAARRGRACDPR